MGHHVGKELFVAPDFLILSSKATLPKDVLHLGIEEDAIS